MDRSIWWHYMAIVVPPGVQYKNMASMYIGEYDNTDPLPAADDEDVELCAALAITSGAVCAVLRQIPNQPVVYKAEVPPRERDEDDMVAYTWYHFLQRPDQPEWLARLPMTKVCRALVTAVNLVLRSLGPSIPCIIPLSRPLYQN